MRRVFTRDGILFVESGVLLALIRLALLVFPFRILLRVVHRASATSKAPPSPPATADIERVQWAVVRASRYVPGARHCLTRALAAKVLFGNKGRSVDLRIGVAKDEAGRLKAHAWLELSGAPILGVSDSELRQYSLLPQLDRV